MPLQRVNQVPGWENFTEVIQDNPPMIVQNGGGLYTRNLARCMCLVATDGTSYGMMHVFPAHVLTAQWATSLLQNTNANLALITGCNGGDEGRILMLQTVFQGLNNVQVIDETRTGWVPALGAGTTPGAGLFTGYIAVDASNGNYALGAVGLIATPNLNPPPAPAPARGRGSCDGLCTII